MGMDLQKLIQTLINKSSIYFFYNGCLYVHLMFYLERGFNNAWKGIGVPGSHWQSLLI